MNGIRPILRLFALAYYRRARAEMSRHQPMHPDLPHVMRRVAELEGAR